MPAYPNTRNITIDVAKGLCILATVMAHNAAGYRDNPITHIVLRCTLAAFFILSGIFISLDQNWRQFIKSKADSLLKPYLVASLFLGLVLVGNQWLTGVSLMNPVRYLTRILYGSGPSITWAPLWYLPSLFVALVSSFGLLRLMTRWSLTPKAMLSVALALLVLGSFFIDVFWNPLSRGLLYPYVRGMPGLPWSIDLLPLTTGFLVAGYVLRQKLKNMQFNPLMSLIVGGIYAACLIGFDAKVDLYNRLLSHTVISLVQLGLSSYLVLQVAVLMAHAPRAAQALAYLGRNSIIILGAHYFIQWQLFAALKGTVSFTANCAISYAAAIAFSVLMIELVNRTAVLRFLLLPIPTKK